MTHTYTDPHIAHFHRWLDGDNDVVTMCCFNTIKENVKNVKEDLDLACGVRRSLEHHTHRYTQNRVSEYEHLGATGLMTTECTYARIGLWRTFKDICEDTIKQGGITTLILGHQTYYVITDPEDALTASNACPQKHFSYDYSKPWLGDGLITSSGEIWKRHRKLLTPAFGLPVVLNFLDVFNSQSRQLVQNLKAQLGKGPFDQLEYFRNNALETFCLTAFGITCFEDKEFIQKYMHAIDGILDMIAQRFQNVWLQSDLIFKLTGHKKQYDKLVKIAHDLSNMVIQKKKAMRDKGGEYSLGVRNKPFLDLLLELTEDNALTDKEIREEVDTAIVTGFDTTSNLLSYIMILLGTHPEVQEKIYREIKGVFQTDRDVDKEDLQQLEYTEAVIKESLRIFTTGPVTLRYVDRDVKLKNYTMRAGSECMLFLFGIHRDAMWGKDARQFRPERWLDTNLPVHPGAFAGFSLGKRSCLGKTYAMISMKTTLVHFIKRYKVTADDSNLQLKMNFLLKPESGHEITIEERIKKH